MIAAALVLGLSARSGALQEADKIGKDRAPVTALKALAEVQKKKGAAISETGALSALQQASSSFQGVLRKDFAAVKGSAEIYAKGRNSIIRTGDRYDQAANLRGEEALAVACFKNPSIMLGDAARVVATAAYLNDEAVEGKDCKVVSLTGDPRLIKEHLQEVAEVVQKQLTGFAREMYSGNLTSYLDDKNSTSKFVLWVGKADLLVYRMEWALETETKPAPLAPAVKITRKCEVKFSQWDEDVPFDIPAPVKAKWGIK
jgi:hypothetical protein